MILSNWLSSTVQRIRHSRLRHIHRRRSVRRGHIYDDVSLLLSTGVQPLEERALLSTGVTGDGAAHDNMAPSVALNYIIATVGVFPSGHNDFGSGEPVLGEIRMFSGNFAPPGWDFAHGQLLEISRHSALFSLIGETYGGGGGRFALPDLRGRAVVGAGQGSGLSTRRVGEKFGTETVTLETTEIPSHQHSLPTSTGNTGPTGGGSAHDNMQPSLALNFVVSGQGPVHILPYGDDQDGLIHFRGRMPVGAASAAGIQLGQKGGAESVVLTADQLPPHEHALSGQSTGSTGGGQAHENRQPWLGLNYMINTDPNAQDPTTGCDVVCRGQVSLMTFSFAPPGWELAHGNGLPDLRGRTVIGAGTGPGLTPRSLGEVVGQSSVTLTTAELPAHSHDVFEFGDAPDPSDGTGPGDYQTTSASDGPRHTLVSGLFLGTHIDGDNGTLQNAAASADDVDGALPDDEDGLLRPQFDLRAATGTEPAVRLVATNTTGQAATLSGWIDYNNDGVFDNATERAQVAVPDGTDQRTVTLTFPMVPDGFTGDTYARFRLSTDAAAQNPTGAATDGEVEDHRFSLIPPGPTINVVAGQRAGLAGDLPFASQYLAVDRSGNVYLTDFRAMRVLRVDPRGNVEVVAGGGSNDNWEASETADQLRLAQPQGVAVDDSGNVYFADARYQNARVVKVDAGGNVEIVAGGGDDEDWDGTETADQLSLGQPFGVAVDGSGNVYFADTVRDRVVKVDPIGNVDIVAGGGDDNDWDGTETADELRLSDPRGVAVDDFGNVYFADSGFGNARVVKVDPTGNVDIVAGGGDDDDWDGTEIADRLSLGSPRGVAVDDFGNVYFADSGTRNARVVKVDPSGNVDIVAGGGDDADWDGTETADQLSLELPSGVAVDSAGRVLFADFGRDYLARVDAGGNVDIIAGYGVDRDWDGSETADQLRLQQPSGVAVDQTGNVYFADLVQQRVVKVDASGNVDIVAGGGDVDWDGTETAEQLRLGAPWGVAVDASGNVYFADSGTRNARVVKVDPSGNVDIVAGGGGDQDWDGSETAEQLSLSLPNGVAVDGLGNVYFADTFRRRVVKVDAGGNVDIIAGGGGDEDWDGSETADQLSLGFASGVAVDDLGNVYFADGNRERVVKVDPSGNVDIVAGGGDDEDWDGSETGDQLSLEFPAGVAVDGLGNVYFADGDRERVVKVDPGGNVDIVAGGGSNIVPRHGDPLSSLATPFPQYIAIAPSGQPVFTDWSLNRVIGVGPLVAAAAPVVSIDPLTTTDTTPELTGRIDNGTADVSVTVAGQTHGAVNHGDGTWTLADNTLSVLSRGVHNVVVRASDVFGNTGTDTTTNELAVATLAFDFGQDGSPVAPGFTRVLTSDLKAGSAFGWIDNSGIGDRDRPRIADDVQRDYHKTANRSVTFQADLADGDYHVSFIVGSGADPRDRVGVLLEGRQVATVTTARGEFATESHLITVSGGVLDVELQRQGSTAAGINALMVLPATNEPRLDLADSAQFYRAGDASIAIDIGLTLIDPDDENLTGATVSIVGGLEPEDRLSFKNPNNISGSYDAPSGVLTLSGTDTVANYRAALQSVAFRTAAGLIGRRHLQFAVDDGTTGTGYDSRTINVLPADGTNLRFDFNADDSPTEPGYTPVLIDNMFSDAVGFGWLTDAVSNRLSARDRGAPGDLQRDYHKVGSGAMTFAVNLPDGTYDVTVTIGSQIDRRQGVGVYLEDSRVDTVSTARGRFRTSTYRTTVTGGRLDVKLAREGSTGVSISALEIAEVTGAPSIDLNNGAAVFETGGAPINVDSRLVVEDINSSHLTGATVSITDGFDSAADLLSFVDQSGIAGSYTAATGVLALTGSATVADYQAALRSVTFDSTANAGSRTIEVQVDDGSDTGSDAREIAIRAPFGGTVRYDFGTPTSDVETGFTGVNETTEFNAALGYGWLATAGIESRNRPGPTPLDERRDYNVVRHGSMTFAVALPNGDYDVTVTIGSQENRRDGVGVIMENVHVDTVTTGMREFARRTHRVTVVDDRLDVEIARLGGTAAGINALVIERVPSGL